MSAALRLVRTIPSPGSALAESAVKIPSMNIPSTTRPTRRPDSRPTTIPSGDSDDLITARSLRETEPPKTQRSASLRPHFDPSAQIEAKRLLATLRLNVDFLESLLEEGQVSSLALAALADIDRSIARLENRFDVSSHDLAESPTT